MSVLTQAYAVPSRVIGVYRYLLHARGQRESLESLLRHLALESLTRRGEREDDDNEEGGGKDMVRMTVNECVAAKLFTEDGDLLTLHPDLPEVARDPRSAEKAFPVTLADLLFNKENGANHDLAIAIAWYLRLDAYAPPTGWSDVERILIDTGMADTLKLNNARYGMLEDWLCYLGFGWIYDSGHRRLVPDPTTHLRWRLRDLFPRPGREPMPAVLSRLASICPVLEGGAFRARLNEAQAESPNQLSTATALAWLRLRDEGIVELHHESDAPTFVLPDGDETLLVSHITLAQPS